LIVEVQKMERDFTLRNKVFEAQTEYEKKYGVLDYHWSVEGAVWTLQDYHSSKGSVLDFTEDDWRCCKENDFTLYEVLEFCNESYLENDLLPGYLENCLEDWRRRTGDECADKEIPKQDVLAYIEDFYTWHCDKFPMVQKIYG